MTDRRGACAVRKGFCVETSMSWRTDMASCHVTVTMCRWLTQTTRGVSGSRHGADRVMDIWWVKISHCLLSSALHIPRLDWDFFSLSDERGCYCCCCCCCVFMWVWLLVLTPKGFGQWAILTLGKKKNMARKYLIYPSVWYFLLVFWDLRQVHESAAVMHLILHHDCTDFLLPYTHSVCVCMCE